MPSALLSNVNKLRYLGTELVKEAVSAHPEGLTARALYEVLPVLVPKRLQRQVDEAVSAIIHAYDVDPDVLDTLPYKDVAMRYLKQSGVEWDVGAVLVLATTLHVVGQSL